MGAASSDRLPRVALRGAAQTHRSGICRAGQRAAAACRRRCGGRQRRTAGAGRMQGPGDPDRRADPFAGRALQFGAGGALRDPDQRPETLLLRVPRRPLCPAGGIPGLRGFIDS